MRIWDRFRRRDLDFVDIIARLLSATDLQSAAWTPEGSLQGRAGATYLATFGLLQKCREMLNALGGIVNLERHHAADPLARSIMEYAATGVWLLHDPDTRLERFFGGFRFHLAGLGRHAPEDISPVRSDLDAMCERLFGAVPPEIDLPSVKDRMDSVETDLYWSYRYLCERTHPTLGAIIAPFMASTVDDSVHLHGSMIDERADSSVSTAITWVWILAMKVAEYYGLATPNLADALEHLEVVHDHRNP